VDVGRFLREVRVEADLTQAALARRAGTSQAAVARYENGVSSPAVATLERLLAACGRTLEFGTRHTSPRDLSGVRARRLRAAKQELLKCATEHGARNLRVFGSVARGDDRPDSDVDLLVDLDAGRGLLDLAELRDALSDLLGERVDVATLDLLRPEAAEAAAAEAVPL
jgi:predicted nucleotidyltransferase/DNA-binding XRE family transcriptional regulator